MYIQRKYLIAKKRSQSKLLNLRHTLQARSVDMFFVCVPVVSVALYICAKSMFPTFVCQTASRCASHLVFSAFVAATKVARSVMEFRSSYIWDKRRRLPRLVTNVMDTLLRVDRERVLLETADGHASICIYEAISSAGGRDYDVTKILRDMWARGDGKRIEVPVGLALQCNTPGCTPGCPPTVSDDTHVVTRVRYRGHSNVTKRYTSETFSARYSCKFGQAFKFPPYDSSETIRRGLGIPRILRAATMEKDNERPLFGPEVTQASGLRRNFYEDVTDDPFLQKHVVSFFQERDRHRELEAISVTTSQSSSKVLCNKSQVPL